MISSELKESCSFEQLLEGLLDLENLNLEALIDPFYNSNFNSIKEQEKVFSKASVLNLKQDI